MYIIPIYHYTLSLLIDFNEEFIITETLDESISHLKEVSFNVISNK